jgi:hypothetical protein
VCVRLVHAVRFLPLPRAEIGHTQREREREGERARQREREFYHMVMMICGGTEL